MHSEFFVDAMQTETLTFEEKQLVGRCLREAVDGPYFPDWEFGTLVGASKPEIGAIASSWVSGQPVSTSDVQLICSVLGNFLGYPHGYTTELERATGATMTNVEDVRRKLDV